MVEFSGTTRVSRCFLNVLLLVVLLSTAKPALSNPQQSSTLTFSNCETTPQSVYDFGVLPISSKLIDLPIASGYVPDNYTYQVLAANDGVIAASFSHQDILNGSVTFSPNVPLTAIGTTKTSSIQFLVSDPVGKTAQCTINVIIKFGFAPQADVTAAFSIVTFTQTPVVMDKNVIAFNEAHGLSMWNVNWTSTNAAFNQGKQGRLEYFTVANGWIPFPLTQPFPHSWIDNGAIRYNPVNFIGSATLTLQLSAKLSSGSLPITGDPFSFNVTITSTQGTVVATQPTPAPPYSQLRCPVLKPDPFPFTYKTPFGPFCGSFQTTANVDTKWKSPFLGVEIVANTKDKANITFGTGIQPTSDQFPPDLNATVGFAGYLDYGSFYIYIDPPTVGINSITFTSPELSYEDATRLTAPSQITGWNIDSRTLFYITSIAAPVPHLKTILYGAGTYVFLAGISQTNSGSSVNYGVNSFLKSWGSKTYTFPENPYGSLIATLEAQTDMTFSLIEGGKSTWSPGGQIKMSHFTFNTTTTQPYNFSMAFSYKKDALLLNSIGARSMSWGIFKNSIDGGTWSLTNNAILSENDHTLTVNVNSTGQWAVFGIPGTNAASTLHISTSLVLLCLFSTIVLL
ncbi:hypothetical protein HDU97_000676 [Phlyctochytrium planicorne]|nr:hypothetical protein HDU97_000676 [Phlyctochytrium planicorne]